SLLVPAGPSASHSLLWQARLPSPPYRGRSALTLPRHRAAVGRESRARLALQSGRDEFALVPSSTHPSTSWVRSCPRPTPRRAQIVPVLRASAHRLLRADWLRPPHRQGCWRAQRLGATPPSALHIEPRRAPSVFPHCQGY